MKLSQENDSLRMRIGQLGSLLSSNTIGAASASKKQEPASQDAGKVSTQHKRSCYCGGYLQGHYSCWKGTRFGHA